MERTKIFPEEDAIELIQERFNISEPILEADRSNFGQINKSHLLFIILTY